MTQDNFKKSLVKIAQNIINNPENKLVHFNNQDQVWKNKICILSFKDGAVILHNPETRDAVITDYNDVHNLKNYYNGRKSSEKFSKEIEEQKAILNSFKQYE